MTKFAKALKKFVKELQKKHPHVPRTFTMNVKSVSIEAFLNSCNSDIDGFINKTTSAIISQNPFCIKTLELSILLSEDVPEDVRAMVWTYLQSMYVYAFYDTHPKSEVETFLQKYGKTDIPSYVTEEWANVARVYQSVYGKTDAALLTNNQLTQVPAAKNSIQAIASEIARDLQKDSQFTDMVNNGGGEDLLKNMMNGENSDMLQQLFSKVSTKITQKIENENLDEGEIMQEATSMFANIQKNPAMASMMKTMMQGNMPK